MSAPDAVPTSDSHAHAHALALALDAFAEVAAAAAAVTGPRSRPFDVSFAAADALVAGLDSPSLRDLAGRAPGDDWRDLEEVVRDALVELGDEAWWDDDRRYVAGSRRLCAVYLSDGIGTAEFLWRLSGAYGCDVPLAALNLQELWQQVLDGVDIYEWERELASDAVAPWVRREAADYLTATAAWRTATLIAPEPIDLSGVSWPEPRHYDWMPAPVQPAMLRPSRLRRWLARVRRS